VVVLVAEAVDGAVTIADVATVSVGVRVLPRAVPAVDVSRGLVEARVRQRELVRFGVGVLRVRVRRVVGAVDGCVVVAVMGLGCTRCRRHTERESGTGRQGESSQEL
jgi:hypothetical protein